jgi:hypothetical protein
MKDVDLARDRPVFRRGQDSTHMNWACLHYDDARTGVDYLTSAECDEINAACNAFFKRKGMVYGVAYMKQAIKHAAK